MRLGVRRSASHRAERGNHHTPTGTNYHLGTSQSYLDALELGTHCGNETPSHSLAPLWPTIRVRQRLLANLVGTSPIPTHTSK
jgi:hypothetical protein